MKIPKWIAYTSALCVTAILLSGCTDRKQLKEDWLQAAAKQETVQHQRFSGEWKLALDKSLLEGAPPLTQAMLAALVEGRIEYSGLSSTADQLQLEADVKVWPKGEGAPAVTMPMLIKDNKMYVHLPVVNKPDEYLEALLAEGDRLKQSGKLSAAVSQKLLQELDPDWLEAGDEQETLEGGISAKRITVSLTDKNAKELSAYAARVLPGAIDEWRTSALLIDSQAKLLKEAASSIQLAAPTTLDVWIDADGYIRQQKGLLSFRLKPDGPVHRAQWTHRTDAMNEAPAFQKEVPALVKPIGDVLKLVPKS
ncbi:hypothetical protein [Paenibacillus sp. YYML68]|uniref:hypothetical protein n=1 Tax=Paenibacillus sp. YYML68 TaxID=2909250 RepID=UPI002491D1BF|nr:hypothetical protein [Paenibacillus sp. YYML68]